MDDDGNGIHDALCARPKKMTHNLLGSGRNKGWDYSGKSGGNDDADSDWGRFKNGGRPPTAAEPPPSATRKPVTVAARKPPAALIAREPLQRATWNPVRMRKETAAKEKKRAPLITTSMAPSEVALTTEEAEGSVGRRQNNLDFSPGTIADQVIAELFSGGTNPDGNARVRRADGDRCDGATTKPARGGANDAVIPTATRLPESATRKLVPVRRRKETAAKEEKRAPLIANSMVPSEVPLAMKEGVGRRRNKYDEQWDVRFKELLDYRSEHGDCDVPEKRDKLGSWVRKQRKDYKADSLARDRVDRLNNIGFKWRLKQASPTVPWGTRFDELVQYKTSHGDCNVPESQGQLGRWVNHQRSAYTAGLLAQDRVDRLNSIGFKWALQDPKVPWETRFNELVQYKAKRGDCNVPRSQGQLGRWVNKQRTNYKKGKLSQDRLDRLNDIGFAWTLPRGPSKKREALPSEQVQSSVRNESVSLLGANVESVSVAAGISGFESNRSEGEDRALGPELSKTSPTTAEPPASATREEAEGSVGQRQNNLDFSPGTIADQVIAELFSGGTNPDRNARVRRDDGDRCDDATTKPAHVGGNDAVLPTATRPPASSTRKLVAVAGYGPPPAPVAREPAHRTPWSPVRIRKETAANEEKGAPLIAKSMAPSEVVALTMKEGSVGRRRNNEDKQWDARFEELVNYRSEHGDCNVPVKGDKLGTWVGHQRTAYKADSLAQDRVDRLNSIGFKWRLKQASQTVPWETRFDELVQYKAKHGDCNVPEKRDKLGSWVSNQREVYKKNKLSLDRVDRLNSIGFKWRLKQASQTVPLETRFDELVQYKARHGDSNVPESQGQLGRWVHRQRVAYKKNKLLQDRLDRLNDIGFDWTPSMMRSKKRESLPSEQVQSSARNENVSLFDANVESVSVAAGTSGFESNRCE